MQEQQQFFFDRLVLELRRLCKEKQSGTLFITTKEDRSARFVIRDGTVIGVTYGDKHGPEAIPLVKNIKEGHYTFSGNRAFLSYAESTARPLPGTPEILQLLGIDLEIPANSVPAPVAVSAKAVTPLTRPASLVSAPVAVSAKAVAPLTRPASLVSAPVAVPSATMAPMGRAANSAPAPVTVSAKAVAPLARLANPVSASVAVPSVAMASMGRAANPVPVPVAVSPPAAVAAVRPIKNDAPAPAKKILVVEDSDTTRKLIAKILTQLGYAVVEAEDGLAAFARLNEESPDLMLLDIVMPGIDGYKVLSMVRKHEKFKNLPIIMMTSKVSLLDRLRGKMDGSIEYLAKPFTSGQLLEKLASI
ncbi:MAG: response regulator [Candidatus Competibacteraceae bacterium]